jgi:hypothetical protein
MFTAAYIKRFRELEQAEMECKIKARERPRLSEFNSAVRNVLRGMSYACVAPNRVMNFLRGVYAPLGVKVSDGESTSGRALFTVTQIAGILDIYSETGRPHGLAVSAIISRLDFPPESAVIVPYGLVGMSVKYDGLVLNMVRDWIIGNGYPHSIPFRGFDYHVYYRRPFCRLPTLYNFGRGIPFTADDLDELCSEYPDCDECPAQYLCTEEFPLDDDWDSDDEE